MTLTIQLFGPYAKAVGQNHLLLECDDHHPMTAGMILTALGRKHPAMTSLLASARLAVNCQYVAKDHPVKAEDELAVIGFVGGG